MNNIEFLQKWHFIFDIIDSVFIIIASILLIIVLILIYKFIKKITNPLAESLDRIATNVEIISQKAVEETDNIKETVGVVHETIRHTAKTYDKKIIPILYNAVAALNFFLESKAKNKKRKK